MRLFVRWADENLPSRSLLVFAGVDECLDGAIDLIVVPKRFRFHLWGRKIDDIFSAHDYSSVWPF